MKRILFLVAAVLALLSCSRPPLPVPETALQMSALPDAAWRAAATTYTFATGDSVLAIRLYRAGRLADLGHNHVISSEALSGRVYVGEATTDTWFDLQLPVSGLQVDVAKMRARYGDAFSADVPTDDVQGTRANMLGPKVLDAASWPQLIIRGSIEGCEVQRCTAQLFIELKGQVTQHSVPFDYEQHGDRLVLHSAFSLQQSALGLKPFSVMMGALSVADEMQLELDLVASEVVAGDSL